MPGNRAVLTGRTSRIVALAFLVALQTFGGGPGFRTKHLLEEHYARYGKEFGQITLEQYLHLAQQLRDAHAGRNILQSTRPTGGGAKFDRRHGWFVAYDGDGTLRTFFIPKDGIHFFESQARTAASPE